MSLFCFTIMLYFAAVLSILVSEKPPRISTIFFSGIFLVPNSSRCLDIVHPVSHSKWRWKLKLFSNMASTQIIFCNYNYDVISVHVSLFCYNAVWGIKRMHVLPAFFVRLSSPMNNDYSIYLVEETDYAACWPISYCQICNNKTM